MALYAYEEHLKVHQVHPSQQSGNQQTPEGTHMRMPGGREGYKR